MKTPRIRFPSFHLMTFRVADQAEPVKIDTRTVAHCRCHSVYEKWEFGLYSGLLYVRWSDELGPIDQPALVDLTLRFSTVTQLREYLLNQPGATDRKSDVHSLLEGIEQSEREGWIGKLPR